MTNAFCASCRHTYRAINGLYCSKLRRYVEHAKTPPCATIKK